jgi:uncharacterized protein
MNQDIGLTKKELDLLKSYFLKFSQINEVILFGSRAMNNHKTASDVDLAILGDQILDVKSKLWGLLEDESPFPYRFDIIEYSAGMDPDLKKQRQYN